MKTGECFFVFFYVESKNKLEISLSLTVFAVEGDNHLWDPVFKIDLYNS
jgi:hypothetical protein